MKNSFLWMISMMAAEVMLMAPAMMMITGKDDVPVPVLVMVLVSFIWLCLFYYSNVLWVRK